VRLNFNIAPAEPCNDRPGDKPDFSYIDLPAAGTTRRPEVDCAADSMRDLAFDLVTVLDDSGQAVGPWVMDLDDKLLLKGLRVMEKTRAFDERMQMAQRQGKTSIYVQCRGEEAIACGQRMALAKGDMCFPTYRQQGLLIAQDFPIVDMICQIYSNAKDKLGGRSFTAIFLLRTRIWFLLNLG